MHLLYSDHFITFSSKHTYLIPTTSCMLNTIFVIKFYYYYICKMLCN